MRRVSQQLAEQTHNSDEITNVVQALEEHYDREMQEYRDRHPQAMMPGEAQMPSGEEISEAFENYLTAIEDRDRNEQRSLPHTARRRISACATISSSILRLPSVRLTTTKGIPTGTATATTPVSVSAGRLR